MRDVIIFAEFFFSCALASVPPFGMQLSVPDMSIKDREGQASHHQVDFGAIGKARSGQGDSSVAIEDPLGRCRRDFQRPFLDIYKYSQGQ